MTQRQAPSEARYACIRALEVNLKEYLVIYVTYAPSRRTVGGFPGDSACEGRRALLRDLAEALRQ